MSNKDHRLELRLSQEEIELTDKVAKLLNLTRSAAIRKALTYFNNEVINDPEVQKAFEKINKYTK